MLSRSSIALAPCSRVGPALGDEPALSGGELEGGGPLGEKDRRAERDGGELQAHAAGTGNSSEGRRQATGGGERGVIPLITPLRASEGGRGMGAHAGKTLGAGGWSGSLGGWEK